MDAIKSFVSRQLGEFDKAVQTSKFNYSKMRRAYNNNDVSAPDYFLRYLAAAVFQAFLDSNMSQKNGRRMQKINTIE